MNKMIVWTVLLASASLYSEPSETVNVQIENTQAAIAPKVEFTPALEVQEEIAVSEEPIAQELATAPEDAPEAVQASTQMTEEAPTLQVSQPAVQAPASAEKETPPLQASEPEIQASTETETPAMQTEATVQPASTDMDEPANYTDQASKKEDKKMGSSRFANIAIGTASAAVIIVASILGTN